MKDSQLGAADVPCTAKYIKANNERFSTDNKRTGAPGLSISRRIMKDSQRSPAGYPSPTKYIKANNERFSTAKMVSAAES